MRKFKKVMPTADECQKVFELIKNDVSNKVFNESRLYVTRDGVFGLETSEKQPPKTKNKSYPETSFNIVKYEIPKTYKGTIILDEPIPGPRFLLPPRGGYVETRTF